MLRDNADFVGKHLHGTCGNRGQVEEHGSVILLFRRNGIISDIEILAYFVDTIISKNNIIRCKRLSVTPL